MPCGLIFSTCLECMPHTCVISRVANSGSRQLSLVVLCSCSLDISPLQQLARQNYGAEVIKYAGGSPLAGEDVRCMAGAASHHIAASKRVTTPASWSCLAVCSNIVQHSRGAHTRLCQEAH
jgi:hypothetical protein